MRIQTNCLNINWHELSALLTQAGLNGDTPQRNRQAFESSFKVVFLFNAANELLGAGRLISDGVRQAAVYDIAVKPQNQGQGLGKVIMQTLLKDMESFTVLLFANSGKELFYEKFGFKHGKTCMMRHRDEALARKLGFID